MNERKRYKIYQDEAKARLTTHWDWDYLPAAELNRIMNSRRHNPARAAQRHSSVMTPSWRVILTCTTLLAITVVGLITSS